VKAPVLQPVPFSDSWVGCETLTPIFFSTCYHRTLKDSKHEKIYEPGFKAFNPLQKSAPDIVPPLYEGDDVPNPALVLPERALDVRSILSRCFQHDRLLHTKDHFEKKVQVLSLEGAPQHTSLIPYSQSVGRANDAFMPGRGWTLHGNVFSVFGLVDVTSSPPVSSRTFVIASTKMHAGSRLSVPSFLKIEPKLNGITVIMIP
jgi:hypothetical protein